MRLISATCVVVLMLPSGSLPGQAQVPVQVSDHYPPLACALRDQTPSGQALLRLSSTGSTSLGCPAPPSPRPVWEPDSPPANGASRVGNVMLELLSGTAAGLVGGAVGAVLGGRLRGRPSWECGDCPGITGAAEAFAVGAALASAVTVYGIGTVQGDNGSFTATLIGAALPAVIAIMSVEVRRDPHPEGIGWVIFTPLGATLAYNLSGLEPGRPERGGRAMLDIESGEARLAVPHLKVTRGLDVTGSYASAKLVSVSF